MATEIYKVLAQSNPAATTLTDIYTVPAATEAVLSTIIVANRATSKRTFRISIAVAGAADTPAQYIAYDTEIDAGEVQEFTIGATLAATDVVRVYASAADLSYNIFGTQIS